MATYKTAMLLFKRAQWIRCFCTGIIDLCFIEAKPSVCNNASHNYHIGDHHRLAPVKTVSWCLRDAAAVKDTAVRSAVAKLANRAAVSEMDLLVMHLQADRNRIGQLAVASSGLIGEAPALTQQHMSSATHRTAYRIAQYVISFTQLHAKQCCTPLGLL